jgi:hypothetical protein
MKINANASLPTGRTTFGIAFAPDKRIMHERVERERVADMHGTMGDNTPTKHRLTYRELAEHFGISADAARMKAKRRVKAGRWAIIPGNHPSDTVRVELPVDDLRERVGRERTRRSPPEHLPRTQQPEQSFALVEQLIPMTERLLIDYREAQSRIRELTDQLMAAKEAHRRDAMELSAAEAREMGTKAELERALADIAAQEGQTVTQRRWWRW